MAFYPPDDAKLSGELGALGQLMYRYSGQLINRANDALERELGIVERNEHIREADMATVNPTNAQIQDAIAKMQSQLAQLQTLAATVQQAEQVINRQTAFIKAGDDGAQRLMLSVVLHDGDDGMIARSQGTSARTGKPQHTAYVPECKNAQGQVLGYTLTVMWCDVADVRDYNKRDEQYWAGRRKG